MQQCKSTYLTLPIAVTTFEHMHTFYTKNFQIIVAKSLILVLSRRLKNLFISMLFVIYTVLNSY